MNEKTLATLRGQWDQRETRRRYLETPEGMHEYIGDMARAFVVVESLGYQWPTEENDVDAVVRLWCEVLKETYIAFGQPGLARAVKLYALEDKSYARRWPSAGKIAELAKRDQPALVEQINAYKKEQAMREEQLDLASRALEKVPESEREMRDRIWQEATCQEDAGHAMVDFLTMKLKGELPGTYEEFKAKRKQLRA